AVAFDVGPRQKPWGMSGLGHVHFPILTNNPEGQQWCDHVVALLHAFWFDDPEGAVRASLRLDPGKPVAYGRLAGPPQGDGAKDFLREAVKRKDQVTERERLYIEAAAAETLPDPLRDPQPDGRERNRKGKAILETLCVKYPDDLEARAFLALESIGGDRY